MEAADGHRPNGSSSTSRDLPEIPPLPADAPLTIGVLALQGAFREHLHHLRRIKTKHGLTTLAVRTSNELLECRALIIPGGESTSISLIASRQIEADQHSLLDWLRSFSKHRAVWGTCAGLILLSDQLVSDTAKLGGQETLGGLPIRTNRNYWGRQAESFEQMLEIPSIKNPEVPFPAIFIRAPMIHTILSIPDDQDHRNLKIIARVPKHSLPHQSQVDHDHHHRLDQPQARSSSSPDLGPDANVVAIKFNNLFATSFHPELSPDNRLHQFWLDECVLKPVNG